MPCVVDVGADRERLHPVGGERAQLVRDVLPAPVDPSPIALRREDQGIVFFHFMHVDLWNGKQCVGYFRDGFFREVTVMPGQIPAWPAP